jgi:hypothetical protein
VAPGLGLNDSVPSQCVGLGFISPLVQDQLKRRKSIEQKIQLVMAVRHSGLSLTTSRARRKTEWYLFADDTAWMDPVLAETEADGQATLQVYVTGDAKHPVSEEEAMDSKESEDGKQTSERRLIGRPDLRTIVREACAASAGRLAIVGRCSRRKGLLQ